MMVNIPHLRMQCLITTKTISYYSIISYIEQSSYQVGTVTIKAPNCGPPLLDVVGSPSNKPLPPPNLQISIAWTRPLEKPLT